MKYFSKRQSFLVTLIVSIGMTAASQARAQFFTNLHDFSDFVSGTNSDGANSQAGLIVSGNTLYGTTPYGGSLGAGTVFKVNTDGSSFTTLHHFANGGDGGNPVAGLVLSSNHLYGTTWHANVVGAGTVFAINTNGTGYTNLYTFTSSGGDYPQAGLALLGTSLFGTASGGGDAGDGTVFAINTDGSSFSLIYSFSMRDFYGRNADGATPLGGLTLSADNNILYGTASVGGYDGGGTVFGINPGVGGWWTSLYYYGMGEYPRGNLALAGNNLYGIGSGPPYGVGGTIFAIGTDGNNSRRIYTFTGDSDGGKPLAGLIVSGNTLYGTTSAGGAAGNGTVFKVKTDGTGFITLHTFSALGGPNGTNADGASPKAPLLLSGNVLYGTTAAGGNSGNGTIFSITLPTTQLTINFANENMILKWPTNASGFTLECTSNLMSSSWGNVTSTPVVVDTNFLVTYTALGAQMFFRLSQ